MSGVAPIEGASEYHPKHKDLEVDRLEQTSTQPLPDEKPVVALNGDAAKQAEKTTIYGFQYTGKGSFIDNVF
ncbi:hypothetical protein [Pseudodesulfovibrio sediminis]|uniref:Uncharacterized protein n=1 Tax=Pseudodesulfovibrio sediminis TaxID=2810563 RepID=A0ABN6EQ58_9BACT|nr:hypothetical protein [Pseudodesulfovibrio sediminis]BCS87206.1 hypothetical protein PSDVSF_04480 [Pseudodesulfovibrio sediminis]